MDMLPGFLPVSKFSGVDWQQLPWHSQSTEVAVMGICTFYGTLMPPKVQSCSPDVREVSLRKCTDN